MNVALALVQQPDDFIGADVVCDLLELGDQDQVRVEVFHPVLLAHILEVLVPFLVDLLDHARPADSKANQRPVHHLDSHLEHESLLLREDLVVEVVVEAVLSHFQLGYRRTKVCNIEGDQAEDHVLPLSGVELINVLVLLIVQRIVCCVLVLPDLDPNTHESLLHP